MTRTRKHPLEIVVSALDKASGPLDRIHGAIDRTFEPLKRLKGKLRLNYAKSGLPDIWRGFRRIGAGVWGATRALGAMFAKLSLVGGAAAAGAFAIVRSYASAGDEIAKTSKLLGISTERLQLWRYAADSSGIEGQAFTNMIRSLGVKAAEAAAGIGEAGPAFDALGVSATDARGQVRGLEDLLPEIADKLSAVENESLRNAIAMRLFEAEGIAMVQMLSEGSRGLAQMEARGRKLGVAMSKDAVKGGERFTGTLADLMGTLRGLRDTIAAEIAPAMSAFFENLANSLSASRERVQVYVRAFMETLPDRLRALRDGLARLWTSMGPVLERLKSLRDWASQNDRWIGVLAVAVSAFAAILLGPLAAALVAATAGVYALGAALLATPVGWIMGALALIAGGLVWLGNNWDWLGEKVDAVVGWIVDKLKQLKEWGLGVLESIGGAISRVFGGGGELEASVKHTAEVQATVRPSSVAPPAPFDVDALDLDSLASRGAVTSAPKEDGEVTVRFENVPAGVDVKQEKPGSAPLKLQVGHAMPEVGV